MCLYAHIDGRNKFSKLNLDALESINRAVGILQE